MPQIDSRDDIIWETGEDRPGGDEEEFSDCGGVVGMLPGILLVFIGLAVVILAALCLLGVIP